VRDSQHSLEAVLASISGLRPARVKGLPMLKQAVVLLWGIGRAAEGGSRLLPWHDTVAALTPLLEEFRRPEERTVGRPDYPIAALHRAGLWELRGHDGAVPTAHGDSLLKAWFAEQQPESGLPSAIWEIMRDSAEARRQAVQEIGRKFALGAEYSDLLRAVGLDPGELLKDVE